MKNISVNMIVSIAILLNKHSENQYFSDRRHVSVPDALQVWVLTVDI